LVDQGRTSPSGSYSDGYFIQARPDGTAVLVGDATDATSINDEQLLLEKLTVDQPPTARFAPPTIALGQPARFSSASSDPDGTVTATRWSFGDGSTAAGTSASHAFAAPGTYQVKLTVTDDYGLSSTTAQNVVVPVPCTARPRSRTILYPGQGAKQVPPRDALQLTLRCSQALRATVTGTIRATKRTRRHHHKPSIRTFRLTRTITSVNAGSTTPVAVKVPRGAITLLRQGAKATAQLTITATAGSGTSTQRMTVTGLKAKEAPTHKR
jgi:PKD repeat protein